MEMSPRSIRVVALAALLAMVSACSKSDAPKSVATPNKARTVRVALAESRPMERVVTVTGVLLADEAATLSVKIGGRLKTLSAPR